MSNQQTIKEWYKEYSKLSSVDRLLISQHIDKFKTKPLISLLTPVYNTKESWLRKCIQSVLDQLYLNWELCLCDNGCNNNTTTILQEYANLDSRIKIVKLETNQGGFGGTNAALDIATGDYIGFLDSDDELSPHALYLIAEKVNTNPDANLIYTDEAYVDHNGDFYIGNFKPDFSPHLITSQMYMGHFCVLEGGLLRQLKLRDFAGSHDYDLILRVIERISWNSIYHIPVLTYKYRQHYDSTAVKNSSYCIKGAIDALQEHLIRIDRKADVYHDWPWYRVKYKLDKPLPHVDILVASINKNGILITFIEKLFANTDYPNYSLYLCIPESVKPEVLHRFTSFIDSGRITFVTRQETNIFNYSILANDLVKASKSSIVCLINDDVIPLNYNWLNELVSVALLPESGIVGAKLIFPNSTLQHAGVTLGIGGYAAHSFKYQNYLTHGYFGRAKLLGNFSMVTGACWVFRKFIYEQIGGYDPSFMVAYGDVDVCIKVLRSGYYNVYAPNALLLHNESTTRGTDDTKEKQERFKIEQDLLQSRYNDILNNDPFYNPNLSLHNVNFEVAAINEIRYKKPWLV